MKSISSDLSSEIPQKVHATCAHLSQAGFKAYLAGGCVRDILLKKIPRDWDVVTNASLDEIKRLFPDHLEVGAAFGIIKLKPFAGDPLIDIAIFRKESGYSDRRHPDKVDAGDEKTDTQRRDFTCNALYYDVATKCILDYVEGMLDIEIRTLRAVGNPSKRFSEDALRIMRAARFSAQLGFKIENETSKAMKRHAAFLSKISRERIRDEIFKLFESSRAINGMDVMMKAGIWEEAFGVKKSAIPADFRLIKFTAKPTAMDWLCALGVTCLLGDITQNPDKVTKTVTESLKLSNEEKRLFEKIMCVYEDAKENAKGDVMDWIELGKKNKQTFEIAKRFIKRARGVSIEDKEKSIKFMEVLMRWVVNPDAEKLMPGAKSLILEGYKEGVALGKELRQRQWKVFWKGAAIA